MTSEVIAVSALSRAISVSLERSFPLTWVRGEVSNFVRAASGHWYFSLKDRDAQIRCVMFRGRNQLAAFTPRDGEAIDVRATVTLYEARGDVQLGVEAVRRAGQGSLFEAFQRLKHKLASEGLFDAGRKQPLPQFPRAIGVITSHQAAALRDVLTTLVRRAPHVPVIIYPAPVQGSEAASRLAEMIALANQRAEVDVLIVCRGGGSIEDLWAFNEEVLARAIAASRLPVVSGVGHETDFTICDFAADVRAATPTAAAELAAPQCAALLRQTRELAVDLRRVMRHRLQQQMQAVDMLSRRLVSPRTRLGEQRGRLGQALLRLRHAARQPVAAASRQVEQLGWRLVARRPDPVVLATELERKASLLRAQRRQFLAQARERLLQNAARLEIVNPQRTLERGYAVIFDATGKAVRNPEAFAPGREVDVLLADGAARLGITSVEAPSQIIDRLREFPREQASD